MTGNSKLEGLVIKAPCLHCGVIARARLHFGRHGGGRSQERVVIMHCEDCGGVSRHLGAMDWLFELETGFDS